LGRFVWGVLLRNEADFQQGWGIFLFSTRFAGLCRFGGSARKGGKGGGGGVLWKVGGGKRGTPRAAPRFVAPLGVFSFRGGFS